MKYQKKQKTFSPRKFRSGLEKEIASQLCQQRIKFEYETLTVKYSKPTSKYTPDFILPNGIIIEAKGQFVSSDRSKHKLIAQQHPDLDIRFVFSNSRTRIGKKSKTTYAMWCDRFGFNFSDVSIPAAWIREPKQKKRIKAIRRCLDDRKKKD
jgi:hypothetical protein